MSRLYDRRVAVTVAEPVPGSLSATTPNAVLITNMRVSFEVERTLQGEPNTCEIRIHNLSEDTRSQFQRKPLHVRIDAGYEDTIERLFEGWLRHGLSKREGTEWITHLEVGDGDRSYNEARISRTFKLGADPKQLISEVTKSMGLKIPTNLAEAKDLGSGLISGTTLKGPSHKELTRLLKPRGYGWSIQNGRLQAIRDGESNGLAAFLITPQTGLVGSPDYGPPPKPGRKRTLTVTSLLRPQILPASLISLESQVAVGTFRVQRVRHTGDTHEQVWYTALEVTAV